MSAIFKSTLSVGSMTLLSRVLGLARDIVIADTMGNVLTSARGLADTETIARSELPAIVRQRRLGRRRGGRG